MKQSSLVMCLKKQGKKVHSGSVLSLGFNTQVTAVISGAVCRLVLISLFAHELGVWGYSIAYNMALQCKLHFSGKVLKSSGVCEQLLTW